MDKQKNLTKILQISNLILSNPSSSLSLHFLIRLSQKLNLNHGPTAFLRKYPRIFHIFYNANELGMFCGLTPLAVGLFKREAKAVEGNLGIVVERLVKVLSMSGNKSVPLRAVFKVYRELGLPDDFEVSVIEKNKDVFEVVDNESEKNTHLLKLVGRNDELVAAVENWRVLECCKEGVDGAEIRYGFKQGFPPGMRLKKNFKAKVKEWQRVPYIGPYEGFREEEGKKRSRSTVMALEKRAVGIVHEFLSLTVEKMVEVEQISHFRKCFGIEFNIRDLFLDHPGIFYLSTKGKKHTVFLTEAYERGCLIEPNPVYDARRKLLDLVVLGRRGMHTDDYNLDAAEDKEDDFS